MSVKIEDIEPKVKHEVKKILSNYELSDSLRKDFTVGFTKEDEFFIWTLYVAKEHERDAVDIAEAKYNTKSGHIDVKVFESEYVRHIQIP
jgi:hypothetical protein